MLVILSLEARIAEYLLARQGFRPNEEPLTIEQHVLDTSAGKQQS